MVSFSGCYSTLFDGLNAEVQIRWLQMVVRNSFYPDLPRLRAFLHKHVRTIQVQLHSSRYLRRSPALRLSPDLQDVHRAAVRGPGFRGDEVRRRGDLLPDAAPPAPQPQTDVTADPVP